MMRREKNQDQQIRKEKETTGRSLTVCAEESYSVKTVSLVRAQWVPIFLSTELCLHAAFFRWCTNYAATLPKALAFSSRRSNRPIPAAPLTFPFFFLLKFVPPVHFSFLYCHKHSISVGFAEICKFSQSYNPRWCITRFFPSWSRICK